MNTLLGEMPVTRSMTGYGRAQEQVSGKTITVEIRSVNHRYFDCSVKAPRVYGFLEEALKSHLQNAISRGKVDAFVSIDMSEAASVAVSLNKPVLEAYLAALNELKYSYGLIDDMTVTKVAALPDVLNIKKTEEDAEELIAEVLSVADKALGEFTQMRRREGERLAEDIRARMESISELVAKIEERSPQTVSEYRAKLEQRMREVLGSAGVDETRLLTEAAIFADRVAVDEETVRLKSHLSQLEGMLREQNPVGRKLDFLVQELNREANTIGSKASDAGTARIVVDLKAEIEKIREQVQNIE